MAARGPDEHRHLSDLYPADAMPEHHPLGAEALPRGSLERGELGPGRRVVGLIVEGRNATDFERVRPDAAGEQHDASEAGTFERPHGGHEGERSVAQANAHRYPPP
jgi:hypothetical protein